VAGGCMCDGRGARHLVRGGCTAVLQARQASPSNARGWAAAPVELQRLAHALAQHVQRGVALHDLGKRLGKKGQGQIPRYGASRSVCKQSRKTARLGGMCSQAAGSCRTGGRFHSRASYLPAPRTWMMSGLQPGNQLPKEECRL